MFKPYLPLAGAARNCDSTSKQDQNEATEKPNAKARPAYLNGGN